MSNLLSLIQLVINMDNAPTEIKQYEDVSVHSILRSPLEYAVEFDMLLLKRLTPIYLSNNNSPDVRYEEKLVLITPIENHPNPRARILFVAGDYIVAKMVLDRKCESKVDFVMCKVERVIPNIYQHPLNNTVKYIVNQILELSIVKVLKDDEFCTQT